MVGHGELADNKRDPKAMGDMDSKAGGAHSKFNGKKGRHKNKKGMFIAEMTAMQKE